MRLIDADKLIKELCEQETELARQGIMLVKGEHSLFKIVNNQPTVDDWIPVSERLPEDGDLFVALETNNGDGWHYEIYDFASTNYHPSNIQIESMLEEYGVIAWRPIQNIIECK